MLVVQDRGRCSLWVVSRFGLRFHHAFVVILSIDERDVEVVHADKMPSELQVGCDMTLCGIRYDDGM